MSGKSMKVAIAGGGVAGSTTALYLGQMGIACTLFEREKSLVTGPPFCHLHAGGNLYREISDAQCVTLLKQSIDFLRYYPFIIDYRPTVIAVPTEDKGEPADLLPRLELLVEEYKAHIAKDPANKVLGKPEEYYRIYERERLESLKQQEIVAKPETFDEWMIPVAKQIDFEKVKFPLILVQEYGLNLFRLAAGVSLALEQIGCIDLKLETKVTGVTRKDKKWHITFEQDGQSKTEHFDYLVNAAGFRTGYIDDMIGVSCKRMVEFKAAYISHWQQPEQIRYPEIIFHGERGTPQGMGQFTPYPDGYFQLHGMTEEITLYPDGLRANSDTSAQPVLPSHFIEKIEKGWPQQEIEERTQRAIGHLAKYIPNFTEATVGSKPLFGAQQIPGSDPTLRVAEVSFPAPYYARCEIVKVSSVLDMVDAIVRDMHKRGLLTDSQKQRKRDYLQTLEKAHLSSKAEEIAVQRDYPAALARRTVPR